jgi:hypothetical protein
VSTTKAHSRLFINIWNQRYIQGVGARTSY